MIRAVCNLDPEQQVPICSFFGVNLFCAIATKLAA
jgi:hypothetical protein